MLGVNIKDEKEGPNLKEEMFTAVPSEGLEPKTLSVLGSQEES